MDEKTIVVDGSYLDVLADVLCIFRVFGRSCSIGKVAIRTAEIWAIMLG